MKEKKDYQEPKYEAVDVAPSQMLCVSDIEEGARQFDGIDED